MSKNTATKTAWERLLPEYRSEHVGWSKAGDFYCPACDTMIGRNLKQESPFYAASAHKREHSAKREQTSTGALSSLGSPSPYHDANDSDDDRY